MSITKKKTAKKVMVILLALALIVMALCPVLLARAAGVSVTASYNSSSGVLSAEAYGIPSGTTVKFEWINTGSTSTKLSGQRVIPTDAGTYYCTVTVTDTETKVSSTYSSNYVSIYKVTTETFVTLNHTNGLYLAGDTVRARATLVGTQKVTNWKSSVSGIVLPSSGNSIYFTMPSASLTLTCTAPYYYKVKVVGGSTNKISATAGETVTVQANNMAGKEFDSWVAAGVKLDNEKERIVTFTMPSSDVTLTAVFKDPETGETEIITDESAGFKYSTDKFTDPTRLLYTVTRTNHYKVRMYHATLGPNYDNAFKQACGSDTLITNYFSVVINDNEDILESPGPVTIVLTLPMDVCKVGRNFRMICISRNGYAYSFKDTDTDDTTLTFSPNRYGAFAIAYNDRDYAAEEAEAKANELAAQQKSIQDSYNLGFSDGQNLGYSTGVNEGYGDGQSAGYSDGRAAGYSEGRTAGYNEGFTAGAASVTVNQSQSSSTSQASSTAHSVSESQTSGNSGNTISTTPNSSTYSGASTQHIRSDNIGTSSVLPDSIQM